MHTCTRSRSQLQLKTRQQTAVWLETSSQPWQYCNSVYFVLKGKIYNSVQHVHLETALA
jgi:hypothetical protein